MPSELREYQKEAVRLLLNKKKAILTNDCNTGKTAVCLMFAKQTRLPTLVVCNASKIIDWKEEGKKFGANPFDIVSFSSAKQYHNCKYGAIIIDESQKMGGYNTLKGRVLVNLCKRAEYAVFASATPMQTSPENLYWPLKLCGVYKKSKDDFRIDFCGAYQLPGKKYLVNGRVPTNTEKLRGLLTLAEVNTTSNNETKVRDMTVHKKRIDFDFEIPKFILGKLNVPEFKEVSNARSEIGVAKLEMFKEWLKTNKLAKKAVFFCYHRAVAMELSKTLNAGLIIGGVSKKKVAKILKDFSDAESGYLVITLKTGGEGIQVFHCNTCYFLEQDFSISQIEQAFQRLSRETLTPEIYATFFIAKNEHTDLLTQLRQHSFNIMTNKREKA